MADEHDEKQRSFWGWGWKDKFPPPEARENIGQQVRAILGLEEGELEPQEPPAVEDLELRPPRIEVPGEFEAISSTDAEVRARHTYGRSYRDLVRGFGGDFDHPPDAVVAPRDDEQVQAVLEWASGHDVAVIPFGGGTSVVGGVEGGDVSGYEGVISLNTRRMNRVLEVDPASGAALIEAGATGPEVNEQLEKWGLTLRHYPQSWEFSTIGGWIATRSGGHYATVYTHFDDFVQSVRMVSPEGLMETRRLPASGAGPDPEWTAIGSEGILGVITRAWVRLQDRPRWRSKASVHFEEFSEAVAATRALARSGLHPANCRLLDAREAMLNGVVFDGSNVLILGFESANAPTRDRLEAAVAICEDFGGEPAGSATHVEPDRKSGRREDGEAREEQSGRWRDAFFEAPYLQNAMVSLGVMADTFETACTWEDFEELHERLIGAAREAMKAECGDGFISCRFTHVYPDGPAPYYTFLAPAERGRELEQWRAVKSAVSDVLIEGGATITHHHAVGRTHREWYDRQRPEIFARSLDGVRKTFDPEQVMNPGVLIDGRKTD